VGSYMFYVIVEWLNLQSPYFTQPLDTWILWVGNNTKYTLPKYKDGDYDDTVTMQVDL
jgi:hypothetical protein